MSLETFKFSGRLFWAQVQKPDKKYGDYRIKFYPKDDETRKAVKATGTKCGVKEDDNGFFYVFKNEVRPVVQDGEGNPVTTLLGNGSEADITLTVESFISPKFGPTARTRLAEVTVTKLIPYNPPETPAVKTELPA